MRKRPLVTSIGLLSMLAVTAGCPGDQPETAAPPAAAPTAAPATPPAAAPAAAPTGPLPPGVTAEMVEQGRQVYAGPGICFTCHGQNAQGTPLGPNLADGQWIWVTDGPDLQTQLVTIIRTGVTQPREYPAPMPPMGGANLNEDQLEAVVAYLMTLN
jgi:mono/diheme cytochrome c family protein